MQVIIREAIQDDMETLLRFEQGVIAAERPFDETLRPNPISYYDLQQMMTASHIRLLVAIVNQQVVGSGYARIEDAKPYLKFNRFAYLGFMYVEPEYRGQGINRAIVQDLEVWGKEQGISELRLEVYHENVPAIKAYEKFGFEKLLIEMRKGLD